jgi:hypothetical protein
MILNTNFNSKVMLASKILLLTIVSSIVVFYRPFIFLRVLYTLYTPVAFLNIS